MNFHVKDDALWQAIHNEEQRQEHNIELIHLKILFRMQYVRHKEVC
mgnify:CR=1 FL=1